MKQSIDEIVHRLQAFYETINIQRACLICYSPDDAHALSVALDQMDFPVQNCIHDSDRDPRKRLYIFTPNMMDRGILESEEINVVFVTPCLNNNSVLGALYAQAQLYCNRPVFFIPL